MAKFRPKKKRLRTEVQNMKTSSKEIKQATEAAFQGEKMHYLPIEKVEAVSGWNSRSNVGVESSGGPEELHEFPDLMNSLEEKGQLMPVQVRPNPKKAGFYLLTFGFRRHTAMTMLYNPPKVDGKKVEPKNIPGLPQGTIKCIIKEQSEAEARTANVLENTSREDLTPADLAWGVYQMSRPESEGGCNMSDSSIARAIGVNQTYVSKLRRIYEATHKIDAPGSDMNIFDHWRKNPVVNTNEMERVEKAAGKDGTNAPAAAEKYKDFFSAKTNKEGQHASGKQSAIDRSLQFATVLGRMVRAGVLELVTEDFLKLIEAGRPFKFSDDVTDTEKKEVAKGALAQYRSIRDGAEEKAAAEKEKAKADKAAEKASKEAEKKEAASKAAAEEAKKAKEAAKTASTKGKGK